MGCEGPLTGTARAVWRAVRRSVQFVFTHPPTPLGSETVGRSVLCCCHYPRGICPLETWSVVWSVHLAGANQLHAQTPFGSEAVSTTQCIPRLEGSVFVGKSLLDLWACYSNCSDREQSGCEGSCACLCAIVTQITQIRTYDCVRIAMRWYLQSGTEEAERMSGSGLSTVAPSLSLNIMFALAVCFAFSFVIRTFRSTCDNRAAGRGSSWTLNGAVNRCHMVLFV